MRKLIFTWEHRVHAQQMFHRPWFSLQSDCWTFRRQVEAITLPRVVSAGQTLESGF